MNLYNKHCPTIAVVIPNYNYEIFISKLVESLYVQSTKPDRIIFIDDGSTDHSLATAYSLKEAYAEKPTKFDIISLVENKGKLVALNRVCKNIQEDITLIVDADDFLCKDFIEKTVSYLIKQNQTDPKIAFAYTDSLLVDNKNNIISRGNSSAFDKESLKCNSYIPECAPTFTKVLKEILPFAEDIHIGTKHHKWMRIIENGWIGTYLKEPLFYYRMHNKNISGIGNRVLAELASGNNQEKILSGYWVTENQR